MQAISSFVREHRMIADLSSALQTFARHVREGAPVDAGDLGRFATVIRELVDYRHHEREESILLPLLARNGLAWSTGVLCDVRIEHRHLRYLIDVFCQTAEKGDAHGPEQRRQIVESALGFVEFKRQHMQREDNELLAPSARSARPELLEQLERQLQSFDAASSRGERDAEIWACAEDLVQRYSGASQVVRAVSVLASDAA